MHRLCTTIYRLNKQAEARALSSLVKSAKFSWEMNTAEKAKADAYQQNIAQNTPTRTNASPNSWWNQAKGLGIGLTSAGLSTALRLAQARAHMWGFVPEFVDRNINGRIWGVDNGRGYFGRWIAKGDRWVDKQVHGLRQWSKNYDYANNLDNTRIGKVNRAISGKGADIVGNVVGWVGNPLSIPKRILSNPSWVGKIADLSMTGFFGHQAYKSALHPEGGQAQLRANEEKMNRMPRETWNTYDPTGTPENITQGAYTPAEYRKYFLPQYTPPSATGTYKWPYSGTHNTDVPGDWWDVTGMLRPAWYTIKNKVTGKNEQPEYYPGKNEPIQFTDFPAN